jgi:hypothetical protein
MPGELSNPLQGLIARAAKSLPATTGDTEHFRARMAGAGPGVVILADVSSSMDEPAGSRRKIDILREALAQVWSELVGARLVAFDTLAREISAPDAVTSPSGGTALHLALDAAGEHRPARTLVITDGRPDSEDAALEAAGRLSGIIDVIYCGPDSDAQAIDFLRRLARLGGGRCVVRDVVRMSRPELGSAVRTTLGLPAPKGG